MANIKDITGQKFGRLTAIKYIGSNKHKNRIWECKCDCGKFSNVTVAALISNNTSSCGCLHRELASKRFGTHHGGGTPLYRTWKNMKQRCYNSKNNYYKSYGGRGIKICDEWLHDFSKFQEWSFKNNYEEGLSIERNDTNGNYEPDNCSWIPLKDQGLNKTTTIKIKIGNVEYSINELSQKHNIPYATLWRRIRDRWNSDILFKSPKFGFKR